MAGGAMKKSGMGISTRAISQAGLENSPPFFFWRRGRRDESRRRKRD